MKFHLAVALALLALSVVAQAEDKSTLRPPKGEAVALVAFEDLQCPDCADVEPLLQEAAARYKIPLVRHDFPLPKHNWAFEAHVIARYFDGSGDAKAQLTGEEFRRWVYANQSSINNENLRGMAERFADQHQLELPVNYDPSGELKKKVESDRELGKKLGVVHTPTVYVVSVSELGAPFVETVEREKLFAMIEQMQAAGKK